MWGVDLGVRHIDFEYTSFELNSDLISLLLFSARNSPLFYLIKEESFRVLSTESKLLITLLLSSPAELASDGKRISKKSIRGYLRKAGWKHTLIQRVFGEIRKFVNDFF